MADPIYPLFYREPGRPRPATPARVVARLLGQDDPVRRTVIDGLRAGLTLSTDGRRFALLSGQVSGWRAVPVALGEAA